MGSIGRLHIQYLHWRYDSNTRGLEIRIDNTREVRKFRSERCEFWAAERDLGTDKWLDCRRGGEQDGGRTTVAAPSMAHSNRLGMLEYAFPFVYHYGDLCIGWLGSEGRPFRRSWSE